MIYDLWLKEVEGWDSLFVVEGNRICDSWGRFMHLHLSICVCVLKNILHALNIYCTSSHSDLQKLKFVHNFTLSVTGAQICFAPNIVQQLEQKCECVSFLICVL